MPVNSNWESNIESRLSLSQNSISHQGHQPGTSFVWYIISPLHGLILPKLTLLGPLLVVLVLKLVEGLVKHSLVVGQAD